MHVISGEEINNKTLLLFFEKNIRIEHVHCIDRRETLHSMRNNDSDNENDVQSDKFVAVDNISVDDVFVLLVVVLVVVDFLGIL